MVKLPAAKPPRQGHQDFTVKFAVEKKDMTCDLLSKAEQAVQEQNPTAKKSRRKRECENLAD